jgi:DNA anti-recombination protein RmuC
MADNELTLSARVNDLEKAVAELRGHLAQSNQAVAQSNRLTIWQFISFTVIMAGTLFGTLAWISGSLREEQRQTRDQLKGQIEQTEQRLNDRFVQMEKRFEQMGKRFEDLAPSRSLPAKAVAPVALSLLPIHELVQIK